MEIVKSFEYARIQDKTDEIAVYRNKFYFPIHKTNNTVYLNGNSLGLQPKIVKDYVLQELEDWKLYGVEGHFKSNTPWLSYHELLTESMTQIVGAKANEVVVMNTLTVNLHLMMVSFYRPTNKRYKIIIEYSAFPSDQYAVNSQIEYHGFNPNDALIELKPEEGELVSLTQITKVLENNRDQVALIMIGGVNYYTGQVYDMKKITELGHLHGCIVGFDLAHGVGNIKLSLHDWDVDFAVWCTYKYLNSGPGSVGGCFVHNKHVHTNLPRFAGWWGHNKKTRFLMGPNFDPIKGVEGWQLSNPSILSLAAVKASLELFKEVGMDKLVAKSKRLIEFARVCLEDYDKYIKILTPIDPSQSGCQLSIVIKENAKKIHTKISNAGVFCDWREPDVIRIAFVPLYNNFEDVWKFVEILGSILEDS